MKAEDFFPPELREYMRNMTQEEPPLLAELRQKTETTLGQIQMLTGPVEGQFLQFLVQLSGAKRCLEIGTFSGYSALYIAQGLPKDGTLITCEIQAKNAAFAQSYFAQSPHGDKITLLLGDALATVPTLAGQFEFIFLDANQAKYPQFYDLLFEKLAAGGLLIIDNALWGGEVVNPENKYAQAIAEFNQRARQDPRLEALLLPIRDGILILRKK